MLAGKAPGTIIKTGEVLYGKRRLRPDIKCQMSYMHQDEMIWAEVSVCDERETALLIREARFLETNNVNPSSGATLILHLGRLSTAHGERAAQPQRSPAHAGW
eukprot:1177000-Prorocentrum_minimum.AAC.5